MATRPVKGGSIIGLPGQGTHSYTEPPNNWQSDRAVDFGVPVGSPVFAAATGVVSEGAGFGVLDPDPGSRFGGSRLTVNTAGGDALYYAHLSRIAPNVKPGAPVREGQLIGYSGVAAGVPHLHFGVERGDPLTYAQATASGNPETAGQPGSGGSGGACDTICIPCDKIPLPDILKRANPLCIPCFLCRTKGGADDVVDAITAIPKALGFLFSWRFVELVGGGALLLLGLYLLGRQIGFGGVTVIQPPAPVETAASEATRTFKSGETELRRARTVQHGPRRTEVRTVERVSPKGETRLVRSSTKQTGAAPATRARLKAASRRAR